MNIIFVLIGRSLKSEMATLPSALPRGFAVLGIIGPDDPALRDALRGWTRAVAPAVEARFAISLRDRAAAPWWQSSAASVEPDVDMLDCLGQAAGISVVILALFDAWLRYAVAHYPDAAFYGRADADAIISPRWLLSVLSEQAVLLQQHGSERERHVVAGSMQWYNWDTVAHRPWGWANGPRNARTAAMNDNSTLCRPESSPRCSGPFPFAAGPLLLVSASLLRWYTSSADQATAVANALTSRLNRTAPTGGGGAAIAAVELSLAEAKQRGEFIQPSDAGDLDVRLFDDVFFGHALCMGGAPNVTVIAFPTGLFTDVPCRSTARRALQGCRNGLDRFNWSVSGAPLLVHHVRQPQFVSMALERLAQVPFAPQVPKACAPLASMHAGALQKKRWRLACGESWRWCHTPFDKQSLAIRARPKPKHAPASRPKANRPRTG